MNSVRLIFAGDTDADSIRLNSGSSMQDGVVTITKKLYFRVPDGQDPRAYSDLDVYGHPNFPQMYSAMQTRNRSDSHPSFSSFFFPPSMRIAKMSLTYCQAFAGFHHRMV